MLNLFNKILTRSFIKPFALAVGLSVAVVGAPVANAWSDLATGLVVGGAAGLVTGAAVAGSNRYYHRGYYNQGYYRQGYYPGAYTTSYRGQCVKTVVKCSKKLRYDAYSNRWIRPCWNKTVPC